MCAKAGELFQCQCCGEDHPEEAAILDVQLGPICGDCDWQAKQAVTKLHKAGIRRPLTTTDLQCELIKNRLNNK